MRSLRGHGCGGNTRAQNTRTNHPKERLSTSTCLLRLTHNRLVSPCTTHHLSQSLPNYPAWLTCNSLKYGVIMLACIPSARDACFFAFRFSLTSRQSCAVLCFFVCPLGVTSDGTVAGSVVASALTVRRACSMPALSLHLIFGLITQIGALAHWVSWLPVRVHILLLTYS
jgi:hypothetical protein